MCGLFFENLRVGVQVPLNQPARALDLLNRVISGQPFDQSVATPTAASQAAAAPVANTVVDITAASRVATE